MVRLSAPPLRHCYQVITEQAERELFLALRPPPAPPAGGKGKGVKRQGIAHLWLGSGGADEFPPALLKLSNAIRDCGLLPGAAFVQPNYAFVLNYPLGAWFQRHFDSWYRWGEVVVGVSLGHELTLEMTKEADANWSRLCRPAERQVRVALPRRSIYVLSGEARYRWKHGLKATTGAAALRAARAAAPSWNPGCERRSITFRSTRAWSDLVLRCDARAMPQSYTTCHAVASAMHQY